jgi:L-ascorbate metabolism protein UlaG (beta-lactamase superfamily)
MKITHYSNSFISVSSQGDSIVCDPWVGKANASGWQSFPEFSHSALRKHLAGVRWVYLSHLHDDHFHPNTLKSCGLLDREFIIKRFESPVLRERLKRLGVTRIHEVDPFTVQQFGPFELSIFPQMTSNSSGLEDEVNYDLDTSIAIKADGSVFFNQVDNPLSLQDITHIHGYINEKLGAIDVACLMSGAASEYPHLFLGIDQISEKRRIVERSLIDLCDWLRLLKPRYFFSAGGTYLIPGWMGIFNDNIAQPNFAEISSHIAASELPVQALDLEGGRFIELSAGQKTALTGVDLASLQANRQVAIEMHRHDSYQYEALTAPEWPILMTLLDTARENWARKVSKDRLTVHQTIQFDIYSQLRLDGDKPDASQRLGSYQICQATQADAGVLVVHIDQRAIFGCLTRRLIWNGVLGALCLFDRRPNRHYPTDFFSINFFTLSNEQLQAFA